MSSLADEILEALKAHEESRPRTQRVELGPSEIGGCREYIRNVMVGTPRQKPDEWPTAAVMGTLIGAHIEDVMENAMGAVKEVLVQTTLPNGLIVEGHADVVLPHRNMVVDAKSKDRFDTVRREGASLENSVQISIYALGLVQAGVLTEGCTAHLIYVDRSGNEQALHEIVLTWDQMLALIDVAMDRLDDVIQAQDDIDAGHLEGAAHLRDKTPPFCYSKKVQCPYRDKCWKGSDWVPDKVIEDKETLHAVREFVKARTEGASADTVKSEMRERLRGVTGISPDGWSVNWTGNPESPRLYVTRVEK